MNQLTFINNTITFRGNNYSLRDFKIVDSNSFEVCDFNFNLKETEVNGQVIMSFGDLPFGLNEIKESLNMQIDQQTKDAIYAGFVFDGVLFSMSDSAQINWSNILNTKDSRFPLPMMGKNDDLYILHLSDRQAFYDAANDHKTNLLLIGGQRKVQVLACANYSDLQALASGWGIAI